MQDGHVSVPAIEISTDHKPDQVEEEHRIVDAGGRVFNGVPRMAGMSACLD